MRLSVQRATQVESYTARESHSQRVTQPESHTARESHSQRVTQSESYTVRELHSQRATQVESYTGRELYSQRVTQPESHTARESHSQRVTQSESYIVRVCGMFTHTLKGNVSAEAPNQTSSTSERNVFLLFSAATHNPLPLLCKAGGRAKRLETHLHNINVRV